MSLFFEERDSKILIRGNTYPHKEAIKKLGGKFLGAEKAWCLPSHPDNLERVEVFCRSHSAFIPRAAASKFQSALKSTTNQSPAMSLSQLMDRIDSHLKGEFSEVVWIFGEVQNLSFRKSGCFLNLAEEKATSPSGTTTIGAKIWQNQLLELQEKYGVEEINAGLQEGLIVRVLCRVRLYRDRGFINLEVVDLDLQFTKGHLALAREKLLKELRASGLDQKNKRTHIPRFPLHIGLITAAGSRAQSDFLDQLGQYHFPGKVSFFSCPMQGERVSDAVTMGLVLLQKLGCDIIVVTRGGGSAADLRWFDHVEVATAIVQCVIPVIAAIGHHDDVCIAEEVCFLRQKTPTAAADYVVALIGCGKEVLRRAAGDLSSLAQNKLAKQSRKQQELSDSFVYRALNASQPKKEAFLACMASLQHVYLKKFSMLEQIFQGWASALRTLCLQECHERLLAHSRLGSELRHQMGQVLQGRQGLVSSQLGILQCIQEKEFSAFTQVFSNLGTSLQHTLLERLHQEHQRQAQLVSELKNLAVRHYEEHRNLLKSQALQLPGKSQLALSWFAAELQTASSHLQNYDPRAMIAKGWVLLTDCNGPVVEVEGRKIGQTLLGKFSDGQLTLTIAKIDSRKSKNKETIA